MTYNMLFFLYDLLIKTSMTIWNSMFSWKIDWSQFRNSENFPEPNFSNLKSDFPKENIIKGYNTINVADLGSKIESLREECIVIMNSIHHNFLWLRSAGEEHKKSLTLFTLFTEFEEIHARRGLSVEEQANLRREADKMPSVILDLHSLMQDIPRPRPRQGLSFTVRESLDLFESRYIEHYEGIQQSCGDYLEKKTEHYNLTIRWNEIHNLKKPDKFQYGQALHKYTSPAQLKKYENLE